MPLPSDDSSSTLGIRAAIAGNPNAGKTSLFNALTGARQKVGNYPGVTVEKREGRYRDGDVTVEVLDLPGTYSLGAQSSEERIAEDALLAGDLDVTVLVVDSTTLSRSMVLAVQVLLTGTRVVLCLNMADEARASGQRLDLARMRVLLGVPVVETVGNTGEGLEALREAIRRAAANPPSGARVVLGERLDDALSAIAKSLDPLWPEPRTRRWTALRLLLGHPETSEGVRRLGPEGERAVRDAATRAGRLEVEVGCDIALYVAEREFGFVDGLLHEATLSRGRPDARASSDAIDRVLAHRILGLPIFLAAMFGLFWITFEAGEYPMAAIEWTFEQLGTAVSGLWPADSDSAIRSLLVDGVIAGVGGVLVFLPNILLLFLGLALLEDTGYMARAAFLVDRVMHRVGLHGKSFLPLVTGFGCSIPGIMGTRVLESERDRLTTMLVLPLMSCGARLPIWMLLVPAFFPPALRAPALWGIYLFGVLLAMGLARLLRSTLLRGHEAPFVMEMPPYRMPTLSGLAIKAYERSRLYVVKAGTIILALSVGLWFLTSYPKPDSYAVDARAASGLVTEDEAQAERAAEDLRHSAAGRLGRMMEPVLRPLGFDWKLGTAMVGALAAKEVFVSQLGIVHSLGETDEESGPLRESLAREYSPQAGFSLMVFLLVGTPCIATVAIVRRESGRWKWALLQWLGLTVIAWVLAFAVFQVGSLLAGGS